MDEFPKPIAFEQINKTLDSNAVICSKTSVFSGLCAGETLIGEQPVIASLSIMVATFLGLGGLLPAISSAAPVAPGYRAFTGFCLALFLVYVGTVVLRISIDTSIFIVVGLAVLGAGRLALIVGRKNGLAQLLVHPVFLLVVGIAVVAQYQGEITYHPYGFDTYANWLIRAKKLWLANDLLAPVTADGGSGYVPGWHLMLMFTAPLFQEFDSLYAIAAPIGIHVVLLAVVYDVAVHWWCSELGGKARDAVVVGWALILVALAGEAAWTLLPTVILAEIPLFYTLIGVFALATMYWHRESSRPAVTLALGLAISAHYLIKKSGLAGIPVGLGLVFAGYALNKSRDSIPLARVVVYVLIAAGPAVISVFAWKLAGVTSTKCVDSLGGLLFSADQYSTAMERIVPLAGDLISATGNYTSGYKFPLTLVALGGVAVGMFEARTRWISVGVLAYGIVCFTAIYFAYLLCGENFAAYLSSLQRYIQVPIRLLHFVGPFILFLVATRVWSERVGVTLNRTWFWLGLLVVIAAGVYQGRAINRQFIELRDKNLYSEFGRRHRYFNRQIPRDVDDLVRLSKKYEIDHPRVLMVYVFSESLPPLIAEYGNIPRIRDDLPNKSIQTRFRIRYAYMKQQGSIPLGFKDQPDPLKDIDIIWAVSESAWLRSILNGRVDDQECAKNPTRYYIIRAGESARKFRCVIKR